MLPVTEVTHRMDSYDPLYEKIHQLEEQLVKLRHCGSVERMLHDERGQIPDPDLPFK